MIRKDVVVLNKLGLHARPSKLIVQIASNFRSEFHLIKGNTVANGKSIIGVMSLAAPKGATLTLQADGVDEEYLIREVANLFESRFSED
jgi:phosphocarrier protein HPr